jgi:hypothetical protein
MRHGLVRGDTPSEGPALCQTLSRLTRSNATAPDETGVSSRSRGEACMSGPKLRHERATSSRRRRGTGGIPTEAGIPDDLSRADPRGAWASPRDNTLILHGLAGSTCRRETGGGRRETAARWLLGAHGPSRPDARSSSSGMRGDGPLAAQHPKMRDPARLIATATRILLFRCQ